MPDPVDLSTIGGRTSSVRVNINALEKRWKKIINSMTTEEMSKFIMDGKANKKHIAGRSIKLESGSIITIESKKANIGPDELTWNRICFLIMNSSKMNMPALGSYAGVDSDWDGSQFCGPGFQYAWSSGTANKPLLIAFALKLDQLASATGFTQVNDNMRALVQHAGDENVTLPDYVPQVRGYYSKMKTGNSANVRAKNATSFFGIGKWIHEANEREKRGVAGSTYADDILSNHSQSVGSDADDEHKKRFDEKIRVGAYQLSQLENQNRDYDAKDLIEIADSNTSGEINTIKGINLLIEAYNTPGSDILSVYSSINNLPQLLMYLGLNKKKYVSKEHPEKSYRPGLLEKLERTKYKIAMNKDEEPTESRGYTVLGDDYISRHDMTPFELSFLYTCYPTNAPKGAKLKDYGMNRPGLGGLKFFDGRDGPKVNKVSKSLMKMHDGTSSIRNLLAAAMTKIPAPIEYPACFLCTIVATMKPRYTMTPMEQLIIVLAQLHKNTDILKGFINPYATLLLGDIATGMSLSDACKKSGLDFDIDVALNYGGAVGGNNKQ